MPTQTGTARELILAAHPDNEMRVTDVSAACGGRFTLNNIANTLERLQVDGLVVRTVDENGTSWWAIRQPETQAVGVLRVAEPRLGAAVDASNKVSRSR